MGKAILTATPTTDTEGDVNTLMMQLHGVSDWWRDPNGGFTIEYDDGATEPETIAEALSAVGFEADSPQNEIAPSTAKTRWGTAGVTESPRHIGNPLPGTHI